VFQHCFNVEDCLSAFTNILNNLVELYVPVVHTSAKHVSRGNRHYPCYIRKLLHAKAVAWKRQKISTLETDKLTYKLIASKCSAAIKKYHAAQELELIR